MATTIGLGVAFGKAKPNPLAFPNFGPGINATGNPLTTFAAWNSSACTQPDGTCLALLDSIQVDNCFELVWSVCHANYNATNLIPQRNDKMFLDNPQCSHLVTQMYCQWESDLGDKTVCDAMKPFCTEEFPLAQDRLLEQSPPVRYPRAGSR
jgi:hypothetical protein